MPSLNYLRSVVESLFSQKKQAWSAIVVLTLSVACLSSCFHIKKMLNVQLASLAPIPMLNANVYPAQGSISHKAFGIHAFEALSKRLAPSIQSAVYQQTGLTAQIKGMPIEAFVIGVDPVLLSWFGFSLKEGRLLAKEDDGQKVAVVGAQIAKRLEAAQTSLIGIQKRDILSVVGVLDTASTSSLWSYPSEDLIIVPMTTLSRLGVPLEGASFIVTSEVLSIDELMSELESVFNSDDYYHLWIQNPLAQEQWVFFEQFFSKTTVIVGSLLGLLGFGMMLQLLNTWFHQRRYEIGLHLALGASTQQCICWIRTHLLLLALISGVAGGFISLLITVLLATFFSWSLTFYSYGFVVLGFPMILVAGLIHLKSSIIKEIEPYAWLNT